MRNHQMIAARSARQIRSGLDVFGGIRFRGTVEAWKALVLFAAVAVLGSIVSVGSIGCVGAAGPVDERPAPSGPLVLTTDTGARYVGPPARLDVRVDATGQVTAELVVDVADAAGQRRAVLTALPASALTDGAGAGAPGEVRTAGTRVRLARLDNGRIEGTLDGARFSGALAVTCAAPRADAPVSTSGGPPALAVDETFTSPACRPYAALGRQRIDP